jgi:hypothetical protein
MDDEVLDLVRLDVKMAAVVIAHARPLPMRFPISMDFPISLAPPISFGILVLLSSPPLGRPGFAEARQGARSDHEALGTACRSMAATGRPPRRTTLCSEVAATGVRYRFSGG